MFTKQNLTTNKTDLAIYKVLDVKPRNDNMKTELDIFRNKTSVMVTMTKICEKESSNTLSFHEYQQTKIKDILAKDGFRCYSISSNVWLHENDVTLENHMMFCPTEELDKKGNLI
jgi:hypothetical protein